MVKVRFMHSVRVCSAHAEVIPSLANNGVAQSSLLRTRGGDPSRVKVEGGNPRSAPHTRR